MREYNFNELLEEDINTQFEVKYKDGNTDISYITVQKHEDDRGKYLEWDSGDEEFNEEVTITEKMSQATFIKVEKLLKPVSFMEVVNSDRRCKVDYYRINELIEEEDSGFEWLTQYQNLDNIMNTLSREFNTIAFKEIIAKGKWYLESEVK
jgi:hypothetical protein